MKKINKGYIIAAGVSVVTGLALGLGVTSASATPDSTYYTVLDSDNEMTANGGYYGEAVNCNSGDTAISGGFSSNNNPKLRVQASAPVTTNGIPSGWNVSAYNEDTTARHLYVYVVCKDT